MRPLAVGIVASACCLLAVTAPEVTAPPTAATAPSTVSTMPDLVGRTVAYAQRFLAAHDFHEPVVIRNSSKYPPGRIYSQIPAAGVELRGVTEVTLYVSTGPAPPSSATPKPIATLPNFVGLMFGSAARQVKALGLSAQRQGISSSRPRDEVLQQKPEPGTDTQRIRVVVLTVSNGAPTMPPTTPPTITPNPVETLPNFVGERYRSAAGQLKMLGLSAQRQAISSSRPRGEVLQQQPDAGTNIRRIKVVTLTVSNGPPKSPPTSTPAPAVPLPNLVGDSFAFASNYLTSVRLVTQHRGVPSNRRRGEVLAQDPRPGVDIRSIKVVTLTVSNGLATTVPPVTARPSQPLPNLVGDSFAFAERYLTSVRLGTHRREVRSSRPRGEVVRQEPRAGTDISTIELVALTVSNGPATMAPKTPPTKGNPVGPTTEPPTTAPVSPEPLPNFVGGSFAFARRFLTSVSLGTQDRGISSSRPRGEVVAQNPQPGVDIHKIKVVALTVSNGSGTTPITKPTRPGPAPTAPTPTAPSSPPKPLPRPTSPAPVPTMPGLVGRSGEDAQRIAIESGLRKPVVIKGSSFFYPAGQVYRQDPPPGVALVGDMTIALHVSTGPPIPPWTPVLILGAAVGLGLGAKAWSHARLVEKTRRLLAIRPSVDLRGETNFPAGVQTAGPAIEIRSHVEPGDVSLTGPIPIANTEVRDD